MALSAITEIAPAGDELSAKVNELSAETEELSGALSVAALLSANELLAAVDSPARILLICRTDYRASIHPTADQSAGNIRQN